MVIKIMDKGGGTNEKEDDYRNHYRVSVVAVS